MYFGQIQMKMQFRQKLFVEAHVKFGSNGLTKQLAALLSFPLIAKHTRKVAVSASLRVTCCELTMICSKVNHRNLVASKLAGTGGELAGTFCDEWKRAFKMKCLILTIIT